MSVLNKIIPELGLFQLWNESPAQENSLNGGKSMIPNTIKVSDPNPIQDVPINSSKKLEDSDREKAWKEGLEELSSLSGPGMRDLEKTLLNIKNVNSFGAGHVIVIAGDRGTGKTELAHLLPKLLYGAGFGEKNEYIDLNGEEFPSRITDVDIWIADDFDEIILDKKYCDALGKLFLTENRGNAVALALIGGLGLPQLLETRAARWISKSTLHSITLPQLSEDDLANIAKKRIAIQNMAIDDDALETLKQVLTKCKDNHFIGVQREDGFDSLGNLILILNRASQKASMESRFNLNTTDFKDII